MQTQHKRHSLLNLLSIFVTDQCCFYSEWYIYMVWYIYEWYEYEWYITNSPSMNIAAAETCLVSADNLLQIYTNQHK